MRIVELGIVQLKNAPRKRVLFIIILRVEGLQGFQPPGHSSNPKFQNILRLTRISMSKTCKDSGLDSRLDANEFGNCVRDRVEASSGCLLNGGRRSFFQTPKLRLTRMILSLL